MHRLRAEIEPVSPADFMRFLFKWQHVDAPDRLAGLDGLREVVAMLDGFELAAAAWERSVLDARVDGYDPSMLDMLCLAGEVAWARLSYPDSTHADPPRLAPATPIALFLREHADAWQSLRASVEDPERRLGDNARRLLAALRARGASFFGDLRGAAALDDEAARSAIGSLVAAGLAASDGFSGLRALIASGYGAPAARDRRSHFAGRWTAIPSAPPEPTRDAREAAVEAQAWALAPPLRRRLPAGAGVARRSPRRGATWRASTVGSRRAERSAAAGSCRGCPASSSRCRARSSGCARSAAPPPTGACSPISTADPLNLVGIVTAGERIRAAARNRVAYRDGVPLAVREGDFVRELAPVDPSIAADVSRALSRRAGVSADSCALSWFALVSYSRLASDAPVTACSFRLQAEAGANDGLTFILV